MKTKNNHVIFSLFFIMFFISETQAQLFKKIQKRVEQKIENVVIDKTADKAAEKTSNSMDEIFDVNLFEGSKEKANPSMVADSYDFTWKYSMKMTSKSGDMVFDYYLKPDASYFGFTSLAMKNMFSVMDNDKKVMVMFMESKGNNIGMVTQIPDDIKIDDTQNDSEKFKFETLPNKTINGFHCKGVKGYNSDYEMIMYFTNETEVSFNDMFKSSKTKIPLAFTNYFNPKDKVLMIFMDMKNLKNINENATMECVGLEKVKKTINKSDYKFM